VHRARAGHQLWLCGLDSFISRVLRQALVLSQDDTVEPRVGDAFKMRFDLARPPRDHPHVDAATRRRLDLRAPRLPARREGISGVLVGGTYGMSEDGLEQLAGAGAVELTSV
jgi:hypothetical protein